MTTKDAMIELKARKPTGRYIFNSRQFRNFRRLFDTLDEDPEAWRIYGDSFRCTALDMWITICKLRKKVRQLKGMGKQHGLGEGKLARRPDLHSKLKTQKFHDIGECEHCGAILKGTKGWAIARLDHITPVVLGGLTTDENTQLLCANCNARKTAEDRGLIRESKKGTNEEVKWTRKKQMVSEQSGIDAQGKMNKGDGEEWIVAAKRQWAKVLIGIYERAGLDYGDSIEGASS